jgi:hypothetical protein
MASGAAAKVLAGRIEPAGDVPAGPREDVTGNGSFKGRKR